MLNNHNKSKFGGNKISKPVDYLPDGLADERYLKEDKEWPRLENRLGKPRQHYYSAEFLAWIQKKYQGHLDNFSHLEVGCGHGNDLRALKKTLNGRGNFLGINLSRAEIIRGLEFYKRQDNEDSTEAIKMFGLGDLHNLRAIFTWDEKNKNFSCPRNLKDGEFDSVSLEAVLHASGYGYKTYSEKKASAQQILDELSRVCKAGGKFLGGITAFSGAISQSQQFDILRKSDNWRFIPELDEFIAMLRKAGFDNIQRIIRRHEKADVDPNKKDIIKISFLVEK